MVFRLRMFFQHVHVSAVMEIGITDQRNWMHDTAGADVIFVASWPLRSRVFNSFCSLSAESQQASPEMVLLGEIVQERS